MKITTPGTFHEAWSGATAKCVKCDCVAILEMGDNVSLAGVDTMNGSPINQVYSVSCPTENCHGDLIARIAEPGSIIPIP